MTQERYPGAIWRPGPSEKAGYSAYGYRTPKRGEIKHSAEGFWPGLYSRLDGTDRASWQFTIGYDRVEQHYEVSVNCWHGGDVGGDDGASANTELIGVEHLGLAGQALTPYQIDETTKLSAWLMQEHGRTVATRDPYAQGWLLGEHNEYSDEPTACPSGRIPWGVVLPRLNGGSPMTKEEKEAFDALAGAVITIRKQLNDGMNATEQALALNKANPKHDHPWWTPKGIYYIGGKAWPF